MAHIDIYSKSLCVQCDATLRTINKAIQSGDLNPTQVTVHMIDGTKPRDGKVDDRIEVNRVEDSDDQAALSALFKSEGHFSAPVVIVKDSKDEDAAKIDSFSGLNPSRIKTAIKVASESAPALAATA